MNKTLWQPLIAFFLCLMLVLIPLPDIFVFFSPVWPVVFLFTIAAIRQTQLSCLWIWALGLVLDLSQHRVLGSQVISLTLVALFLIHFFKKIDTSHLGESMLGMGFSALLYSVVLGMIDGALHEPSQYIQLMGQAIASAFLWPWIKQWLVKPRRMRHKMI